MLQLRDHTAAVVAALDDPHPDVRAAALDALTYLHDVASLPAVVVRLHDASLHPARRLAALAAFGPECEDFLLELSQVDAAHLVNYAQALAICGTRRSRPVLARWTHDARPEVRAAAFEALAHVGVDAEAASLAIEALESDDDAGPRDGRVRAARLDGLRRRRRAPRAAPRRRLAGGGACGAVAPLDGQRRHARAAGAGVALRSRRPARAPDAVADGRTMLTETASSVLVAFSVAVIVYFVLWNASQMAMSPIALLFLSRHRVRHRRHARALAARLASPPLVSVIVPVVQRGAHDRRERARAAGARLRGARDHRRQRRVVRRHAGRAARRVSARARAGGVRAAVADRGGAGDVPVDDASPRSSSSTR